MQESLPVPGMKGLSTCPRCLDLLLHRREDFREVGDDLCLISDTTSHLLNYSTTKQVSLLPFLLFPLIFLSAEGHGKELAYVQEFFLCLSPPVILN